MSIRRNQWWYSFKNIGDITIFHVDLTPHAGHENLALAWLDEDESLRWQRFQSSAARRRFALCRAALRVLLCGRLSCENESLAFEAAKHGKPFAKVGGDSVDVAFNVSHSGRHGMIAVASDGQLGVDVEERTPRKNLELLIEGVFSPQEKAELEQLDRSGKLFQFFRIWTLKEALIKAHGKGMSLKVSELEIPENIRHGASKSKYQFPQFPNIMWSLEDISNGEFAAAFAYKVEPQS